MFVILATSFIHLSLKSQLLNYAVSRNWFLLIGYPQYRNANKYIHPFLPSSPTLLPRLNECSHLFCDYLKTIYYKPGLSEIVFSLIPCLLFSIEWVICIFCFPPCQLESYMCCFFLLVVTLDILSNILKLLKSKINLNLDHPPSNTSSFPSLISCIPFLTLATVLYFKST